MEADIIQEPFFITMLAVRAEEDVWTRSIVEAIGGVCSSRSNLPALGDWSEQFAGVWRGPSPSLGRDT